MNAKHREVSVWLEKQFGDEAIPHYEINPYTVDLLHQLMLHNEKQDNYTQLLLKDYNQKAEEYAVEAKRLNKLLHKVGLSTGSLSQSGLVSLRSLASVALLLEIKDASDSSFLVAQSQLLEESLKVGEARQTEQKLTAQLFDKTKAALLKSNSLNKSMQDLKEQEEYQKPELDKKARQAGFLQSKAQEYKTHIDQLQIQWKKLNVDPSFFHQSILNKQQELKEIQDQLTPLRKKVDSYQSLPPDISLAKVKLEEVRRELIHLEEELSKNLDFMHM